MLNRLSLWLLLVFMVAAPAHATQHLVTTQDEFSRAIDAAAAGETIVLANGEWRDFDMVVSGRGSASAPITVRSQEAGKVILTGQSSLRIGGEHIVVKGLVFRDGYSPRGDVIAFRTDAETLANNVRVTEMVIDRFSKPDRYESDYWVSMYGQNNRFDHNHLVGKTNKGVTLAVRLNSEESRQNNHRIDFNYFGPRPVLGSNGGETLRVGTSHFAEFDSNTLVENNIFDRCEGEVEIISSKSGSNIFHGNLFLQSRGTLTLRHGDGNLVERNVFLGRGRDYTGGIRVINRRQTIRENYMEGLRGTAFSSALGVMNGVPNSPANRYVEVSDAKIERNTIVDASRITFGLGADEERSAPISRSIFAGNLLGAVDKDALLVVADADVSGLSRQGNRLLSGQVDPALAGLGTARSALERAANGLLYPVDPALANTGAPRDLQPVTPDQVGVSWYAKPGDGEKFGASGTVRVLEPGNASLETAIAEAAEGDVLMLADGTYVVERTIALDKTITLMGASSGAEGAVIMFARPSLFELREGANLKLGNLTIDGAMAPDSAGNSVIRTSSYPIQSNLLIEMDGVSVRGLTVNRSFNVLTLGKSSLADRVIISNSAFADISGAIVSASAETEDYGQYNVDYLVMTDNAFSNVGGAIADIYRGGRDESTFGPNVTIVGNALANVGKATTNGTGSSLNLHGVQIADVSDNVFESSVPLRIVHTVGTPRTAVTQNVFTNTGAPVLEELNYDGAFRGVLADNAVAESAQ